MPRGAGHGRLGLQDTRVPPSPEAHAVSAAALSGDTRAAGWTVVAALQQLPLGLLPAAAGQALGARPPSALPAQGAF